MSVEILVPAGSYENFITAVNNGADAVYLGGSNFSARANAVNFTDEQIAEAVRYAHIRGAKVYVALNTLIEDSKLSDAYEFAKFCYGCGVDALIVQDLGILSILRKNIPDFKLNASTQMTVHNLKGVKAAERAGFSRIVLSRELAKEEIGDICKGAKAEIEVFAHGALCMSYSGQCLMSSFIGGRSGNRGACAQPCRLPYTLLNPDGDIVCENKYILSLKDLCLLDDIGTLGKTGVKSLKIEGRMKNSAYVAMTSALYNKYRQGGRVDKEDIEDLQSVFSRNGFTKGYFENSTGRHMLNIDDSNDEVYKNVTDKAKKRAEDFCRTQREKIPLCATFTAYLSEPAILSVWDGEGNSCAYESEEISQAALNVPLTEERVRQQILKTGGTPFEFREFDVSIEDGISLPVKELNSLRRKALEDIEKKRSEVKREVPQGSFSFSIVKNRYDTQYSASVMTYEQAKALEKTDVSRIYIPSDIYDEHKDEFLSDRFFALLPAIERHGKTSEGYERVCVSNFSQVYDNAKEKHGNFRLNVFNSESVKFLKEVGFGSVCLSTEMNMNQIRAISKDIPLEVTVYGYIPAMTVQNCLFKSAYGKCQSGCGVHYLKDRKGILFPVICQKDSCTNVILNSKPIYMGDKMAEIENCGLGYANFNFTVESGDEILRILDLYRNGKAFGGDFTRGHFYRGV